MRSAATPSSRALFADLEEYVHDHRPHGRLTADATEPAWNGYLIRVTCPCGVVFWAVGHVAGCRGGSGAPGTVELVAFYGLDKRPAHFRLPLRVRSPSLSPADSVSE